MTKPDEKPSPQKAAREKKLAQALRANLRRRKAAAAADPDAKPKLTPN